MIPLQHVLKYTVTNYEDIRNNKYSSTYEKTFEILLLVVYFFCTSEINILF